MLFSIDRFEGDIVVLEGTDGARVEVARALLPQGAREGDMLRETDAGFALDEEETQKRRAALYEKQRRLFENSD